MLTEYLFFMTFFYILEHNHECILYFDSIIPYKHTCTCCYWNLAMFVLITIFLISLHIISIAEGKPTQIEFPSIEKNISKNETTHEDIFFTPIKRRSLASHTIPSVFFINSNIYSVWILFLISMCAFVSFYL